MQPVTLTFDMILTFLVIGAVVFLFIVEWVRVDVVAILTMVALPMLGLIDGHTAFAGFSSTAVISIIAVIIIGRGLDHTGVISRSVRPLLKLAGRRPSHILAVLCGAIALISSVMQNIGAAALFLPAIRRISRETGQPLSRLLMPVGAAAILGGTVTLVGSSPLIMLNDLIEPYQLRPFSLFSVTPVGVVLVAVGIAYFILLGKYILPQRSQEETRPTDDSALAARYYGQLGKLFEMSMPLGAKETLVVRELCDRFMVHAVALQSRDGHTKLFPPDREAPIKPGATIAVFGTEEQVGAAAREYNFTIWPEVHVFANDLSSDISGVAEAVVPPHSQLIGKTLEEIRFRHNYLLSPLALFREEHVFYNHLGEIRLQVGDAVLMHGTWERFQQFRQSRDLMFSQSLDHELLHPQKAGAALACLGLAIGLVIFTDLRLSVSLMAGAVAMVLSGALTIEQAYRGVDWRTVFLLAGLIPLGLATQQTGAAAWVAHHMLALLHHPPEILLLLLIALLSTVFTLVVSNVGATVLLVPLVVSLAQGSGLDPRLAALVVGLAASNSFLLPTHQVNALYMGPGRYHSTDFLKAGTPLSILVLFAITGMVYLVY